jgi:hypothetical protein
VRARVKPAGDSAGGGGGLVRGRRHGGAERAEPQRRLRIRYVVPLPFYVWAFLGWIARLVLAGVGTWHSNTDFLLIIIVAFGIWIRPNVGANLIWDLGIVALIANALQF